MDILGFMVSGAIVYKNTEEYGRREAGQRELCFAWEEEGRQRMR